MIFEKITEFNVILKSSFLFFFTILLEIYTLQARYRVDAGFFTIFIQA